MRFMPYGESAVLAEVGDPHLVPALRAAAARIDAVLDAVAGASTVLAVFDPARTSAQQVRTALEAAALVGTDAVDERVTLEITVSYDGADLAWVAAEVGLDTDQFVSRHCGAEYTVRFCGFSPGFAYLDGLDPALRVPRRNEPRTAVPAGSVAIAGEFTGVYPRSSPGGWRLLGRTDADLWDVTRDPPALLAPGARVRFVPT